MEDTGVTLSDDKYHIIHNFVDTRLFDYVPKSPDQRRRILSIRPFVGRKYANDQTVQAILALVDKPLFQDLEFLVAGNGELFEQTVSPLRGFSNVRLERRFFSQGEIAQLHREYGVFLTPTRMDWQGVSRDEAMSSGLVPITSDTAAVPEFVDSECGILTPPEEPLALADAMTRLYHDPELFRRLSKAAADRVRRQCGAARTIDRELALIAAHETIRAEMVS
jgi:glycosyltransferase involved in cell wall biosynthesis